MVGSYQASMNSGVPEKTLSSFPNACPIFVPMTDSRKWFSAYTLHSRITHRAIKNYLESPHLSLSFKYPQVQFKKLHKYIHSPIYNEWFNLQFFLLYNVAKAIHILVSMTQLAWKEKY